MTSRKNTGDGQGNERLSGLSKWAWSDPVTTMGVPGYQTLLPPLFVVHLEAVSFSVADFAAHDIVCPLHIQRSVVRRQKEFFYARLAARRALLALHAPQLSIPVGPARQPHWPDGFIGSITHNRDFAAVLVVPATAWSGVGIDIETVDGADHLDALQTLVVAPSELAYLSSLAGGVPLLALLTIVFSAKESFYKAAYGDVGRFFDFSDAHVTEFDLERQCLLLTLQTDLSARFARSSQWRVHFAMMRHDTVISAIAW